MLNSGDIAADLGDLELVDTDPDVIVLGGAGPEFSYDALNHAFRYLQRGTPLVAMHRNHYWRTEQGLQLDAGAFVTGLEHAAGARAVVVGKPAPEFFAAALRSVHVPAQTARSPTCRRCSAPVDATVGGACWWDAVSVRYIVDDVAAAVAFYTGHLGFEVDIDAAPGFAALSRGPLQLLVNVAGGPGGASQAMPDGQQPAPGGWNRIQLTVTDLVGEVDRLRLAGLRFRNDIVIGRGGAQILLEDPTGNLVELFQPTV